MHVFIDTNILLNFFHFSKDELDALNDVFGSHQHGTAHVHLTQQVRDEFKRNRENKIKDALKRFKEARQAPQLPSFMKGYEEYSQILSISDQLQTLMKAITLKVDADIVAKRLLADQLIFGIFERSTTIQTTQAVFAEASMRLAVGNPPGKPGSIGDAINWIILLQTVPDGEPLHIVSADGDYFSSLNDGAVHPFLDDEWRGLKKSNLRVYRTLTSFVQEHFDGVAFAFDSKKDALIEALSKSGWFAGTHKLIAELEAFQYFSLKEVERILAAAVSNDQVGLIVTDRDVSDFLHRVAVPRLGSITSSEQKDVLLKVIEERRLREAAVH